MKIGNAKIDLNKVNFFEIDSNYLNESEQYGVFAVTDKCKVACLEKLTIDEANFNLYYINKGLVAQGYRNFVLLKDNILNLDNIKNTKLVGNLLSSGYINFEFKCGQKWHLYHDVTENVYDTYNEFKKIQKLYEDKKLTLVYYFLSSC